ncbi:MAG: anti-sigma factor [Bacteroidota bacterium]|nr:anti-sigma factor [Bacteroidota bacterium]
MNTKEYIGSGILELYASGMLTESESKQVEEIIKKYPEVKDEYEYIQKTIYLSISNNLKTPSKKVKAEILNNIANRQDSFESNLNTVTEPSVKKSDTYRYLMAASIAFLLLSLGANFFLWNKLNVAKNEIALLSEQKKIIVQEYEAVSRKLGKASMDMEIMEDRNYKMVDLKGLEKSPSSHVVAFWNPDTKKVYVEVKNLPMPPPDKQYQLWALSNGKPIDAGVMDVDPSDKSLHEMKSMQDAQAFAITLEPKGGSVNPTMDQMYAMGKI